MKVRSILILLSMACACICACLAEIHDDPDAPAPVQIQMNCDSPLVEITEPKFITGYVEIDQPFPAEVELVVGSHRDTATLEQLYVKLDSLLNEFNDGYDYEVYVNTDDPVNLGNMAVIVPGTNERSVWSFGRAADWREVDTRDGTRGWINNQIYVHTPGVKWYFVWSIQGLFFGGTLNYEEYTSVVKRYQSMRGFNFLDCPFTQGQCDTLSLSIKGCNKKGREWADFKFGNTSDTIPPLFQITEWDYVRW